MTLCCRCIPKNTGRGEINGICQQTAFEAKCNAEDAFRAGKHLLLSKKLTNQAECVSQCHPVVAPSRCGVRKQTDQVPRDCLGRGDGRQLQIRRRRSDERTRRVLVTRANGRHDQIRQRGAM